MYKGSRLMDAEIADCDAPPSPPVEGAVRLVPLNGTAPATATCDDVHFGAVELFRDGIWGRICDGQDGGDPEEFTLDAQVVCRQLGFPFGTVMNEEDFGSAYDYDSRGDEEILTWASEVQKKPPRNLIDWHHSVLLVTFHPRTFATWALP